MELGELVEPQERPRKPRRCKRPRQFPGVDRGIGMEQLLDVGVAIGCYYTAFSPLDSRTDQWCGAS